ncbi:MAG: hypothetical protein PHY12_14640, partial [Eubacteriales bacterium]|nr:hypothetical protein [Eubacteriales bacterium]
LVCTSALAAQPDYPLVNSEAAFVGTWTVSSSYDDMPYITFGEDHTYAAYDWFADEATGERALLSEGTFTFEPADGTLVLSGTGASYTLMMVVSEEARDYAGEYSLQIPAGTNQLLLWQPEDEDGYNMSALYVLLPMGVPPLVAAVD